MTKKSLRRFCYLTDLIISLCLETQSPSLNSGAIYSRVSGTIWQAIKPERNIIATTFVSKFKDNLTKNVQLGFRTLIIQFISTIQGQNLRNALGDFTGNLS